MEPISGGVISTVADVGVRLLTHFGSAKTIKRNSQAIIDHEVAKYMALEAAKDHVERMRQGSVQEINMPNGRKEPYISGLEFVELNTQAAAIDREINVSKCVVHALEDIQQSPDSTSDNAVENDWLTRWRDNAAEVSDERMRLMWGKILAGEIKDPGSFSLNTMEIIRGLSSKNAAIFLKLAACCLFVRKRAVFITENRELATLGFTFEELLDLSELGILTEQSQSFIFNLVKGKTILAINASHGYLLENPIPEEKEISISIRTLTRAGTELFRIIEAESNMEYFELIGEAMAKTQGVKVTLGPFIKNPDGMYRMGSGPLKTFQ